MYFDIYTNLSRWIDIAYEFFTLANSVNANIITRDHMYKLFPHHSRIDARKYFFAERIVRVWNGLPAEQRYFSSLIQFNNFINSVDLSINVSLGFLCCVFNWSYSYSYLYCSYCS